MPDVNYWAVLVAAVAALMEGALWNSSMVFGNALLRLRGLNSAAPANQKPPLGKMLAELVRCLVVATVLAHFAVRLGVADWSSALALGAAVWVGFQGALLAGAVLWEDMPLPLYAIHAGDALVKTLLMAVILGVWR